MKDEKEIYTVVTRAIIWIKYCTVSLLHGTSITLNKEDKHCSSPLFFLTPPTKSSNKRCLPLPYARRPLQLKYYLLNLTVCAKLTKPFKFVLHSYREALVK
jgi:hypothetical protein